MLTITPGLQPFGTHATSKMLKQSTKSKVRGQYLSVFVSNLQKPMEQAKDISWLNYIGR